MNPQSIEFEIDRANDLSVRLQNLLVGKQHVMKTNRDGLSLCYWSLIFEHHQGTLLLFRTKHYAPAFALLRPIVEAFLRLDVAIHGTEAQLVSLKKGTYQTEYTTLGEQIDERFGLSSFGRLFTTAKKSLHGFTHGGLEQLLRRFRGTDIIANYPDGEIRDAVQFTTMLVFFAALEVMHFLEYPAEFENAQTLIDKWARAILEEQGKAS